MPSEHAFLRQERAFAAYLRDPERRPAPEGVEARRLDIYRELFFNNVEGFLAGGFPVLRSLTPDERWHALARDFYARHRCRSPYFLQIAREFLAYLEQERGEVAGDFPFLAELAHYEWVELALSISEAEPDWTGIEAEGDLLAGIPVLSPLAWPLAYAYDVHRIGPGHVPEAPPAVPTFLVVYRDTGDAVRFMEINPATARLLELLVEAPDATGADLLRRLGEELHHPEPPALQLAGRQTLQDLRDRGILLGARKPAPEEA